MAGLTGSLFDNFDSGTVNAAKWSTFIGGGSIQNTNGQLRFYSALTGMDNALDSVSDPFSLINSMVQTELVSAGDQSLASLLIKASRFGLNGSSIYFGVQANSIYAFDGSAQKGATTYSATNHRWLRLQERAGTVYWYTSASNTGPWGTLYATVLPFAVGTSTFLELAAEAGVELSTTVVIFDNFNIISGIASPSKQTVRFTVNLPTSTKGVNKTGQPAKQTVRVLTNAVTASKVSTKTASLTQAIVKITTGVTTASGGSVVDNKTASTVKQLISVITGATSASKQVNKTSSLSKQVISVITGTLSVSKGSSKTASITKAIIIIQTGVTTASTGTVADNKTASVTKAIVNIVLNSPTVTISRSKSASITKANIRFLTNTTSGIIPASSSGIYLTAYGKSRIDTFINSDDLEVSK